MAYRQLAWRFREPEKKRVQFNVMVPKGFKERVVKLANRLDGRWDLAGVVMLGVETLEKLDKGEVFDSGAMFYPLEPTVAQTKKMLRDAGLQPEEEEG